MILVHADRGKNLRVAAGQKASLEGKRFQQSFWVERLI